jgi:hypothetical protein
VPTPFLPPRRLAAGLGLLAGVGGLLLTTPRPAAAVSLKSGDVACDERRRTCYDADGPSLAATRRHFGRNAERDLYRRLTGRPPVLEVQFSSGELCDFRARVCWDDGWRRRNRANRLSRHLFGEIGSDSRDPYANRRCELRRDRRRIYSGDCRLTRRRQAGGDDFLVQTGDGRRYLFERRSSGGLRLRDATGSWPVRAQRRDYGILFRWSDLELAVERTDRSPWGDDPRRPEQQVIEQLLEGLFR